MSNLDDLELKQAPLGKNSQYQAEYAPQLLFAIPRKSKRDEIGIKTALPFSGLDIWNAYELSWLNSKGKPMVAIAEFYIDCQSSYLVESKSIKLYLNSFNQTQFASVEEVKSTIEKDMAAKLQGDIKVKIILPQQFDTLSFEEFTATCLDDLDITCDTYLTNPKFLQPASDKKVEEKLVSHLLKSNCLVTNQPDWGSVYIHYQGQQIDHQGLLKYIVSFRNHNEFHEQCVERIFVDIMRQCQPEKLTVYARYTRRGGLDINPFRSNFEQSPKVNLRNARQ